MDESRTKYEAPSSDDRRIWDLWLSGNWQPSIVVADEVGVFASLGESAATLGELARRLDVDDRAIGVLVRLLASLGLIVPHQDRFQLTDSARLYFLRTSPFYWGHMMRVGVSQWHCDTLRAKLKNKGSADSMGPEGTPQIVGAGRPVDDWARGEVDLERARGVAASMHSHSLPAAIGAARNGDFKGVTRLLDVGGGSGCFAIAIAQAHPHLRCTVMELPAMCEVAASYIAAGGAAERVDTVAIDMFRQAWPRGYDALFFSNVFHDWNHATCTWLAARAFGVLPHGGRIWLHEMLLDDDGAGPVTAASFSMLMLLATQGQQFTFGELKTILEQAGFAGIEATHTCGYYSITTGYKR